MHLRRSFRFVAPALLGAASALAASPALAHPAGPLPAMAGSGVYGSYGVPVYGAPVNSNYGPTWGGPPPPPRSDSEAAEGDYGAPYLPALPVVDGYEPHTAGPGAHLPPPGAPRFAYSQDQREDWLRECRRRYRQNDGDDGIGGALIGGAVGGFAGNRIAGRGNRAVGTIAGAAVGAVAGAAIDRAEDNGRIRDICEDYLDRYEQQGSAGYYGTGYGYAAPYGYGAPGGYAHSGQVMWVPMVVGWNCKPREKIVEEWIEEKPARRVIPKAKPSPAPIKSKTVPIKGKTVKTTPTKTVK